MFSLNLFTELSELSEKIFVIVLKGFKPANFCVRYQDATTVSARLDN